MSPAVAPRLLVEKPGWRPWLLAVLVLVFLAPAWSTGRVLLWRDLFYLDYPAHLFYRQSLLDGQLPLWAHQIGCGEPFLASMDVGAFYPVKLVFVLLPFQLATVVYDAIHLLVAALATYALARHWNLSPTAGLVAAIVISFNTWSIMMLESAAGRASMAWLPVCLLIFAHWLARPAVWRLALLALAISLTFLAGWPEGTVFTVGSLLVYAACAAIGDWRRTGHLTALLRPVAVVGLAGVVSGLISAVQLMPTLEAVELSQRSTGIDPRVDEGQVNPLMLCTLLIPSLYGVPGYAGKYWAPSSIEYSAGTFYVGILPLVILAACLLSYLQARISDTESDDPRRRIATWFVGLLAVFSLIYAMGNYTPLFPLLWNSIPLLQKFRWPSKALGCFVFSIGCLSAIGLDYLRRAHRDQKPERLFRSLPWVASVLAIGVATVALANDGAVGETILRSWFNLDQVPPAYAHRIPWGIIAGDTLKLAVIGPLSAFLVVRYMFQRDKTRHLYVTALLVGVLIADLWMTASPLMVYGDADLLTQESDLFAADEPAGAPARFRHVAVGFGVFGEDNLALFRRERRAMRGWWPLIDDTFCINQASVFRPRNVTDVFTILEDPEIPQQNQRRLLRMLHCNSVVYPLNADEFFAGRFDSIRTDRLDDPLPRAYVVGGVTVLPDRDSLLRTLGHDNDFDPLSSALIVDSDLDPRLRALVPGRVDHSIDRVSYGKNQVEVELRSTGPGLMVLSDTDYPGWRAWIDDEPATIYPVNGGFRGVKIAAGQSHVRMSYRPDSLVWGGWISLVTLMMVSATAGLSLFRSRAR